MSLTNYGEDLLLTALKNSGTLYLALFSAAPSETGGGTELSGNGYARQSITLGTASSGTITNTAMIQYPSATGNWNTATHFGIFDASTSGNMIAYGALQSSKTLTEGDVLIVAVGNLEISLD